MLHKKQGFYKNITNQNEKNIIMNPSSLLTVQSQPGPGLRASKWLTCPVLLDIPEMQKLLDDLGVFWMFPLGGLIPIDQEQITKKEFIEVYSSYVSALKEGNRPNEDLFRRCFTSAWTVAVDHLYAVRVADGKEIIKIDKPIVQLQHHTCEYSTDDKKFRSMVFGVESMTWGIQFSYPQLYQDKQLDTHQVDESPRFPNTAFFRALQRWMRQHTIPTPFIVEGKRVNVPIRLGKQCLDWINNHPQLAQRGLSVKMKI